MAVASHGGTGREHPGGATFLLDWETGKRIRLE